MSTTAALSESAHVEAFCCTGTSPGSDAHASSPSAGEVTSRFAKSHFLPVVLPLSGNGPTSLTVAYQISGPEDAPVVVALGGISANRHLIPEAENDPRGWWPGVAGAGCGLDPARHRLVSLDWLGGPEGAWPTSAGVTPEDQARAVAAVLDHLGVDSATLVGSSYGGLVTLAFSALFPERVRRSVVLCAAHRAHPMATAIRSVQRGILRLGTRTAREEEAVRLARALAMTTYRSAEEFEERFPWAAEGDATAPRFPVESYLDHAGRTFSRRFGATAYLRLSESIDLHAVAPDAVVVPTTLVSVDSDVLTPPWLVEELAQEAPGVTAHVRLSSVFGHDAFLKEVDAVSAVLHQALAQEVAA